MRRRSLTTLLLQWTRVSLSSRRLLRHYPAHLRTLLTGAGLSVPVTDGRCALGTWQGIYLWEHRHAPHRRTVIVTVQGDAAQS